MKMLYNTINLINLNIMVMHVYYIVFSKVKDNIFKKILVNNFIDESFFVPFSTEHPLYINMHFISKCLMGIL